MLTASFTFKGQTVSVDFKVNSVAELTPYTEKTYYYSSVDGVFFQADNAGKLTVVDDPLSEIFGKTTDFSDLFVVYDENGDAIKVDVTNNMLVDVPTARTEYLDTYIDLYTDEEHYIMGTWFKMIDEDLYQARCGHLITEESGDILDELTEEEEKKTTQELIDEALSRKNKQ